MLSAPFSAGPEAWAFAEHYKRSLKSQLHLIIAKHPKYTWGGAKDLDEGLDCSGYVYLAAKWAGIPGVSRTTSFRMSQGFGGWESREIGPGEADDCDLVFWTFRENRPEGHVGVLLQDDRGRHRVTHSSARRGVVLDVLRGPLRENPTKVRRLTIGE